MTTTNKIDLKIQKSRGIIFFVRVMRNYNVAIKTVEHANYFMNNVATEYDQAIVNTPFVQHCAVMKGLLYMPIKRNQINVGQLRCAT